MPALVLAAGLGTRLRPLTDHVPKPAVPVLGRPLMGWALAQLYAAGVRDLWANCFHLADRLQATVDSWVQRRLLRLRLGWSVEGPQILGTGGALRELEPRLSAEGGAFLLLNGDSILRFDVGAFVAAHRRNRAEGAVATLLCVRHPRAASFGAVRVDARGRILDLNGHARRPGASDGEIAAAEPTVFAGVHSIESSWLSNLPPKGEESCVVRQGYAPWMRSGGEVRAFVVDGDTPFHDVGTPERYLDAQRALLDFDAARPVLGTPAGVDPGEAHFQEASWAVDAAGREYGNPDHVAGAAGARFVPPFFFGPGNSVGPGACIGPDVSVGARNHIGQGATIEDCALWSGVTMPDGAKWAGRIAAVLGGELRIAERASGAA